MSRLINTLTLEEVAEPIYIDPQLSLVQKRNEDNLLFNLEQNQSLIVVKGSITVSF